MTEEVRGAVTIGETKLITEPLNREVEFTRRSSMKTIAETSPYAGGITNVHACEPPSIDTDLGNIEIS